MFMNRILLSSRYLVQLKSVNPYLLRPFSATQNQDAVDPRDKSIKELTEKIEKLKKVADEYKKELEYSLKDRSIIVKRYTDEIDKANEFSISKFAKSMVEVQDNFKRALSSVKNIDKSKDDKEKLASYDSFAVGIKMNQEVMTRALNKYGVVEYNPVNEKFNPNWHKMEKSKEDATKPNGTIAEVFETGYKIGNKRLRFAKVAVVKN